MILTKSGEYAVRMIFWLMKQGKDDYIRIKDISTDLSISYYQLGKVSQRLISAGILDSYTGPNGGVRLGKSPDEISLQDIIGVTGRDGLVDVCILGLSSCSADDPCQLHEHWTDIKSEILSLVEGKTMSELYSEEVKL